MGIKLRNYLQKHEDYVTFMEFRWEFSGIPGEFSGNSWEPGKIPGHPEVPGFWASSGEFPEASREFRGFPGF